MLQRDAGATLHYQIRQWLEDQIRTGQMQEEQPLPTEEKLSQYFEVSRGTVRRAITDMVRQGVLYRVRGKGTFIRDAGVRLNHIGVYWRGVVAEHLGHHWYYGELMRGFHEGLSQAKCSYTIGQLSEAELRRAIGSGEFGGVIVVSPYVSEVELTDLVARSPIPSIVIAAELSRKDVNYVATDNAAGIEQAVYYLLGLKHRSIAFVGAAPNTFDTQQRRLGFERIVAREGLDRTQVNMLDGTRSTRDAVTALFDEWRSGGHWPTAVITGGLAVTVPFLEEARRLDVRIPDDISLISFDDMMGATFMAPALTAIRQPLYEVGLAAAEFIAGRVKGQIPWDERLHQLIPPELRVRGSCKAISEGERLDRERVR